jgi:HrpA-like RNA helicase
MKELDKLNFIPGKLDKNHIVDILNMVKKYDYSVLISPTGSGKSTLVPPAFSVCLNAKVFCSQPTIIAASDTAKTVKKWYPFLNIGTAFDGNINYTKNTDIVYCTSGHLRNKLISYIDKKDYYVDFCDVLIVDEAHNGTLDNEVIMGLWKLLLKKGIESKKSYTVPRLLLASATLSKEVIPFEIDNNYIKIEFKSHHVDILYNDKNYKITDNNLYTDVAIVASKMNKEIEVNENGYSKWLIFCPGKGEVEITSKKLKELLKDEEVITVHSGTKQDKDDSGDFYFNRKIGNGKRMFVVATNVFETSMTLEGCDGVFDTLTEKNMTQTINGTNKLVTEYISKTSAIQRKGRTGRVGGGFCFRMCKEDFYEKNIQERRPPEIERLNLSLLFLQIFNSGIQPEELFGDRIKRNKREKAIIELKYFDLIKLKEKRRDENLIEVVKELTQKKDKEEKELSKKDKDINNKEKELSKKDKDINNKEKELSKKDKDKKNLSKLDILMKEEFEVTEKGFFINNFEFSLRNGCLLWEFTREEKQSVFPGLLTSCLLETASEDSFFQYPPKKDMDNKTYNKVKLDYYQKRFSKWNDNTNIEILLNMWLDYYMREKKEKEKEEEKEESVRDWCKKNSIRYEVFNGLLKDIKRYLSKLKNMGYITKIYKINKKNIIFRMNQVIEEAYKDKIIMSIPNKKNTFKSGNDIFTLDNKAFTKQIMGKKYDKVVILSSLTIALGDQEKNIITNFFPLKSYKDKSKVKEYEEDKNKVKVIKEDKKDKNKVKRYKEVKLNKK